MSVLPLSLQRRIRTEIRSIWDANWQATDFLVRWQENDGPADRPDATATPQWLSLEITYGAERPIAFGGGRGQSERLKFGSVVIRGYTSLGDGDAVLLDLIGAAEGVFRSKRVGPLSFIGDISGFDTARSEDGAWHMEASLAAWEYRFRG